MHSTNYFNTLIEVAEDSAATKGEVPPQKGDKKSVASLQYELLQDNPYKYTSDDALFMVFATRKDLTDSEKVEQRKVYFSKGQPCFRASPLTKRYGWGVHSDAQGRIALYGVESEEYDGFVADGSTEKTKAMRSKRA